MANFNYNYSPFEELEKDLVDKSDVFNEANNLSVEEVALLTSMLDHMDSETITDPNILSLAGVPGFSDEEVKVSGSDTEVFFKPHPKQQEFMDAVLSGTYSYLLYGGAIRGGKTFVILATLLLLCKIYPGSRWIVVRKTNDVLNRNVLPSFNKLVPSSFLLDYNKSTKTAIFKNKSEIMFMAESADEDPEMDRFKGLEINGGAMEEADECREALFWKLVERAGSWALPKMPKPLILLSCNPNQGWVKKLFYTPYQKGVLKAPFFYLPAKITDNPHIPQSFLDSIKNLPEKIYKRFVEGSWDAGDNDEQLISWVHLTASIERVPNYLSDGPYSLGVDPARYGKDRCIFYLFKGFRVIECREVGKTDIPEVAEITREFITTYNIPHDRVFMDVVGLGGGAYDILHRDGYYIQQVIGGSKAIEQSTESGWKFYNLNAQINWNTKLYFENGLICGNIDEQTLTELAAYRYIINSERTIRTSSKDDIKKVLGVSPDKADGFKYALWGQIYDKISPLPGFS